MLSERKIDDSLPKTQFLGDVNGGGILFYVREDIPAKLLSVETLPTGTIMLSKSCESCVDLILTNSPCSFENSGVVTQVCLMSIR